MNKPQKLSICKKEGRKSGNSSEPLIFKFFNYL